MQVAAPSHTAMQLLLYRQTTPASCYILPFTCVTDVIHATVCCLVAFAFLYSLMFAFVWFSSHIHSSATYVHQPASIYLPPPILPVHRYTYHPPQFFKIFKFNFFLFYINIVNIICKYFLLFYVWLLYGFL